LEAAVTARPRPADDLDAALSLEPGRLSSALERSRQLARDAAPGRADDGAEDGTPGNLAGGRPPSPDLHAPRLTRRQLTYCAARATGLDKHAASEAAGVSYRAVCYWQRKPALAAALEARTDELTAERVRAAKRHLAHHTERAARVLVQLLDHEDGDVRRKAAAEVARLGGLLDTATQRQHAGGPRILIQRAVLALTDAPGTDEGTPRDRG
jgi:hypothetical protein